MILSREEKISIATVVLIAVIVVGFLAYTWITRVS